MLYGRRAASQSDLSLLITLPTVCCCAATDLATLLELIVTYSNVFRLLLSSIYGPYSIVCVADLIFREGRELKWHEQAQ